MAVIELNVTNNNIIFALGCKLLFVSLVSTSVDGIKILNFTPVYLPKLQVVGINSFWPI